MRKACILHWMFISLVYCSYTIFPLANCIRRGLSEKSDTGISSVHVSIHKGIQFTPGFPIEIP